MPVQQVPVHGLMGDVEARPRRQAIELSLRLARYLRLLSVNQFSAVVMLTDSVVRQASGWRKSTASAE